MKHKQLSTRREEACKKLINSFRDQDSPHNPLTAIVKSGLPDPTHNYDLRNNNLQLLPIMPERGNNSHPYGINYERISLTFTVTGFLTIVAGAKKNSIMMGFAFFLNIIAVIGSTVASIFFISFTFAMNVFDYHHFCQDIGDDCDCDVGDNNDTVISESSCNKLSDIDLTISEVAAVLLNLVSNKVRGPGGIPSRILSKVADEIAPSLCIRILFNMSLSLFELYLQTEVYLTDRRQKAALDRTFSDCLPVMSGVPQGSILGPLLFVLYVNDVHNYIQCESTIALFADDSKLFQPILDSTPVTIFKFGLGNGI
ncbi:Hypothetical predicted protein [Paramuricea clavata]|uniref:Uncharacterized protein n=1 Tax=Paramuricea clavata TaxID=317549 RepID=A0A7D9HIL7_PARCT|nr:Hypothetical predicted protein [Paramuricea clavata]